jgi:hypothetical protein
MNNTKQEIEDLKKFTDDLQDLIENHHHAIYLIDEVFEGYHMMLQAAFTEIEKLEKQN